MVKFRRILVTFYSKADGIKKFHQKCQMLWEHCGIFEEQYDSTLFITTLQCSGLQVSMLFLELQSNGQIQKNIGDLLFQSRWN